MTNEQIRDFLEKHAEKQFKDFTSSLIPGTDSILGVRLPVLRSLAKQLAKEDWRTYLKEARDDTYEEIMLQGLVIGYVKAEMEELLEYAAAFIPKIHDWSVNDGFCSTFKIVRKHRAEVWDFLMQYRASESEFEQRVVAVMLMDHFLVPEYIGRVLAVYNSRNPECSTVKDCCKQRDHRYRSCRHHDKNCRRNRLSRSRSAVDANFHRHHSVVAPSCASGCSAPFFSSFTTRLTESSPDTLMLRFTCAS